MNDQDKIGWQNRCHRWGQIGLREIDPVGADVAWWTDVFRRTRIDGLTINAGGSIFFYPSKLPVYRAKFLGDRDLFGELVAAARSADVHVLARIDSWGIQEEIYYDHPEWVLVDENERPLNYRNSEMFAVCPAGSYHRDFIPQVLREVLANYDVSGIFDRGGCQIRGLALCQCVNCERRFRQDMGGTLPRKVDWDDPDYKQWIQWRYKLIADLWSDLDDVVRAEKPWAFWQGNLPGHDFSRVPVGGNHWKRLMTKAAQLGFDHQSRQVEVPPTSSGEFAKLIRMFTDGKPALMVVSAWYAIQPDIKRTISRPDADLELWMAEVVASGARVWWHSVGAANQDRRWVGVMERFSQWHADNEEHLLGDRTSMAEVAMVFSRRTLDYYGRDDADNRVSTHMHGMYHALVRERIAFDWIHEDDLTSESINRYRVLVLPNVACLSDEQCQAIRRFTEGGGNVVATFETSLYDEWGERREDYGLADVLGVRRTGRVTPPLGHVYQLMRKPDHPTLAWVKDTDNIAFNGSLCMVRVREDTDVLTTLIPAFPTQPPETIWPPIRETSIPTLIAADRGTHRVVYFPGDTDRQAWEQNYPDLWNVIGASVRWALGKAQPVEVDGVGLLDVQPYIMPNAIVVHMVNLDQAGFWKAPVQEITPLVGQKLSIQLPQGRVAGEARLLVSGKTVHPSVEGGIASVSVETIDGAHEVVVLDLR